MYIVSFTLTDGIGVRPLMSTSSVPASNAPEVKFAASTNQSLIRFTVNSLQEVEADFAVFACEQSALLQYATAKMCVNAVSSSYPVSRTYCSKSFIPPPPRCALRFAPSTHSAGS
jgi:hypothetical protein